MGKYSISQVKSILQSSIGLFFEKIKAEVDTGNEDMKLKVLDTMDKNNIGHSIMHQAGITAKMLGVKPKGSRVTKRNI